MNKRIQNLTAMEKRTQQLVNTLVRVVNKAVANEKKPRHFGVPELMHASEIHMVMHIGDNHGVHISELARLCGITRGAVSQLVAKLEKKGLVAKTEDPQNSLKTVPMLTNKGKVAYFAHAQHHEEMDRDLFEFINRLDEDQFSLIEDFLNHLEKMADRRK